MTPEAIRPCLATSVAGALFLVSIACAPAAPPEAAPPPDEEVEDEATPLMENDADPRVGLGAGLHDGETAERGLELVTNSPRPEGFYNPQAIGDFNFVNSDMGFRGDYLVMGNFSGFQIYDISDPENPTLRVGLICPGGQGDVSIHGDLVFMSVEQLHGRVDCGTEGVDEPVSEERFRGVRIFDISDMDNPTQVAAVQACRGSHTHTLVTDPNDDSRVWVYNSGAAPPRSDEELEGCLSPDEDDPDPPFFQIEVIEVPLDAPEEARIVSEPRVFADEETGEIAGLWPGGDSGEGTQQTARTDHCHDITAYPDIGLAAGACSGNGILLDISDPANPVRINEVFDENFAYWHSATFNNDGTSVVFTDEWGGGTQARCREEDPEEWGANAIFTLQDGEMERVSYYKMPAPQTEMENCVAHNGSLVPVPGRDIKVQAWYQGGISVMDFTDPANPFEIAFFDRGPISSEQLIAGGFWSAYWYNGHVYGSEMARGLDVLRLTPTEHLTQNEIDAANEVVYEEFNPQHQPRIEWPESFAVARAYLDQLVRGEGMSTERAARVAVELDRAEALAEDDEERAAVLAALTAELEDAVRQVVAGNRAGDAERLRALASTVERLAAR